MFCKSGFKYFFNYLILFFIYISLVNAQDLKTIQINYESGWNLLSIPIFSEKSFSVEDVFPGAEIVYTIKNDLYVVADSVETGKGYWVLFLRSGNLKFEGKNLFENTIPLKAGLNLIGGISAPALVIDTSNYIEVYEYSPDDYSTVTVMEEGKGYFIMVDKDTIFNISEQIPLKINNDVVVIDSTSLSLASDSTQIENGIYTYTFFDQPPTLNTNSIIVAGGEEGYLRRINNVVTSGNQIILETDAATLEDVFHQGVLELTLDEPLLNKYSKNVDYIGEYIDLSGIEFFPDKPNVSLKITQGFVDWNYIPSIKWIFGFGGSQYFHVILKGSLRGEAELQLITSEKHTFTPYTKQIGKTIEKYFPFTIFGLPIVIKAELKLFVKFIFSLDELCRAKYMFSTDNDINIGIKYTNNDWNKMDISKYSFEHRGFEVEKRFGAKARLELIPEVVLYLYGAVGPGIQVKPFIGLTGKVKSTDNINNWNAFSETGFDLQFVVGKWFGDEISPFGKPKNLNKNIIWEYPKSSIYNSSSIFGKPSVDGSQVVQVVEPSIRVIDKFNNGFPFVPVQFEVLEGGGYIESKVVTTKNTEVGNGIASTKWILGDNDNIQKLKASVRDTNNQNIEYSPLFFTANIPDAPYISEVKPNEIVVGEETLVIIVGENLGTTSDIKINRKSKISSILVDEINGTSVFFDILVENGERPGEAVLSLKTIYGWITTTINLKEKDPIEISNKQGKLLETNSPDCEFPDGTLGNLFEVSFDYFDPYGNVGKNTIIKVIYNFLPSMSFGNYDIPDFSFTGDGRQGRITFYNCTKFGGDDIVTTTLYIVNKDGLRSNSLSISFLKPDGGNKEAENKILVKKSQTTNSEQMSCGVNR